MIGAIPFDVDLLGVLDAQGEDRRRVPHGAADRGNGSGLSRSTTSQNVHCINREIAAMESWRLLVFNWRKLGIKGVSAKAMMLLEDMWFDLRYKTDTFSKEKYVDPEVTSANARDAIRYAPTRSRYFHALMSSVAFPPGSVFVDVGAGKGKVMMMAMDYPFKRVVGIEFSSRLRKIAEQNIQLYCKIKKKQNISRICECDVVDYVPKPDENVFFLYNPFKSSVMDRFIENIQESMRQYPRAIWLIYYDPLASCREIIENKGEFSAIHQMDYLDQIFTVYEHKGEGARTRGQQIQCRAV